MLEFLKLTPIEKALKKILEGLPEPCFQVEEIDTLHSVGRVLAEEIRSDLYLPAFDRSSVDGFAVRALDTLTTSDNTPAHLRIKGEVAMGRTPGFSLLKGEAGTIHTGGMLPPGADAVVMLEDSRLFDDRILEVHKVVKVNENVLQKGEDVQPGYLVIPAGKCIRPEEVGGLMALGKTRVKVNKKPVVHLVSSGDELVSPERVPQLGQVRDINSYTLAALVEKFGGSVLVHPVLPDDPDRLEENLRECLQAADLVVITAGSSASERDMTAGVINRIGNPGVLVHGVSVKPGKPTILAVNQSKPVIGLPGNPVSALVIARLFVIPLLDRLSGLLETRILPQVSARLTHYLPSLSGRDDYVPVILKDSGTGWDAEPIFFKSNLIFSMVRATGLVHIPSTVTEIAEGTEVTVLLL